MPRMSRKCRVAGPVGLRLHGRRLLRVHAAGCRTQAARLSGRAGRRLPKPRRPPSSGRFLINAVTCHNQRAKTAAPMLVTPTLTGLFVTGWSWSAYAYRFDAANRAAAARAGRVGTPGGVSRRRSRPRGRGGAQCRAHPAPSPEPYGIRQCRPRPSGRGHPADCCRRTTPFSGSTTSPARSGVAGAARTLHGGRPPGEPPRRRRRR